MIRAVTCGLNSKAPRPVSAKLKTAHIFPKVIAHLLIKFKKCKQTEDTSTCFNESPIWIGKSKIKMVTDAKYLGVYLDQKLAWRVHIDKFSKNWPQALMS